MKLLDVTTTATLLVLGGNVLAQSLQPPGAIAPLVEQCGPAGVVCVNKYVRS